MWYRIPPRRDGSAGEARGWASLIGWEQDVPAPHAAAKEMSAVTGGGGIVVVAGTGHMASMEEPGVVNEALLGF